MVTFIYFSGKSSGWKIKLKFLFKSVAFAAVSQQAVISNKSEEVSGSSNFIVVNDYDRN
jgi:hypothetical protein